MRYLDKYDIITYDNNKEYIVINSVIIEDSNFVYLVNKDDPKEHLFAMVEKDNNKIKVNEIDLEAKDNKELLVKLLEELGVDMYKEILERSS
ncbi:MAG: hypothetical protein IKE10_00815 [Bacilli bacterium]|nr:hypothetical protein [Bacilli bacterium]